MTVGEGQMQDSGDGKHLRSGSRFVLIGSILCSAPGGMQQYYGCMDPTTDLGDSPQGGQWRASYNVELLQLSDQGAMEGNPDHNSYIFREYTQLLNFELAVPVLF